MLPDLVQLVRLNETSVRIMMALVFILVGFGIANTFILTIVERFRELGILKAMGMTPRELMLLIFLESFIVCLIATAVGLLVGCGLTGAAARHGIDINAFTSHNQYFVVTSLIRPRLTLGGVCWMVLLSTVVSLVSASLPTRIAARKVTAETLRFA